MDLKSLALLVLERKQERKPQGNTGEKERKLQPLKLVEKFPTKITEIDRPQIEPVKVAQCHNNTWLDANHDELKKAGFTDRDIYGQGWFTGLADLHLWQIENLKVELRGDQLCFTWNNGYTEIKQTCRPDKWRR